MSTSRTPATPVTPSAQKQLQATPSGSWRHPKLDEINRRQYATTFDERNVRTIVTNLVLFGSTFLVFPVVSRVALFRILSKPLANLAATAQPAPFYLLWAFRILLLANAAYAFYPLARRSDDIADIPLTPSQRQALGLDPNVSTPMTPGSVFASPNYVTPPRYQKSTPRSSFGTPGEHQSSLSGSPRAGLGQSTSNSPFSPNTGSPLFQSGIGGSATRRISYDGRTNPLSSSLFDSTSSNSPGTPTPGAGRASVGLNNKWLYEKRRDSPRSNLFN